jgi:cytochrome b6-f complex iron-sulfur subunit
MASIAAGEQTIAAVQSQPKAEAPTVLVDAPSRREFLYYIWGASVVLLLGQTTAGIIWFALPRFKEGTFGGVFNFPVDRFPLVPGAEPESEPAGRFHVVHTANEGIVALYAVCTHLGCLPKWQDTQFNCPCHGSQFTLNGNWITGPAPRGLDFFPVTVTFEDGSTASTPDALDNDGNAYAVPLAGRRIAKIEIDTGKRLKRPNHG